VSGFGISKLLGEKKPWSTNFFNEVGATAHAAAPCTDGTRNSSRNLLLCMIGRTPTKERVPSTVGKTPHSLAHRAQTLRMFSLKNVDDYLDVSVLLREKELDQLKQLPLE